MTEREKLAAKIRALREKTVANGCTEDEAISAAAKAAEMLEKHNLTWDEVEMRASPFESYTERHDDPVGERLWKVAAAVAKLTGTTTWKSRPGIYPFEVNFFGFAHEVDVARYMLEICAGAMRREQAALMQKHLLLSPRSPRARRILLPFLDGMADRLHQRILALVPPPVTGKGLGVLRQDLIRRGLKDVGIKLQDARARPSRDFEPAYLDGLAAGDRVALNKGLEGDLRRQARLA